MECPVVATKYGKVQGRLCSKLNDTQVFNYSKIPFAKPPIKDLRFKPPQDPASWTGVLKCDKNNVAPVQDPDATNDLRDYFICMNEFNVTEEFFGAGTEDCLYLDVYTKCPNSKKKLPVIFWIYGGGFQMGASGFYNGKVLASLHDVIVVVPNYRVNAFGFFTMGKDSDYPGNMGMLDQVKALEWVRDNISEFGGDPNNVTIQGESAGAMSVGLHCLSPLSKGLFHKAISHSGVADFPSLVKDNYDSALKALLTELKITTEDPGEIMKKLKSLGPNEITSALVKQNKGLANGFSPVVDGHFLPDLPSVMFKEKKFHNIPYIIGFNSDEGSGFMQLQNTDFKTGLTEEKFDEQMGMVTGAVCMQKPEKAKEVMMALKTGYAKHVDDNDQMKWSRVMGMLTRDMVFTNCSLTTLKTYSDAGADAYMYYLNQPTMWIKDPTLFPEEKRKAEICDTDHGDDIFYTFGYPFYDGKYSRDAITFTDDEKECSRAWMTYITNFATTGNPNDGNNVPAEWTKYSDDKSYIIMNKKPECQQDFGPDNYKIWTETIPAILTGQAGTSF